MPPGLRSPYVGRLSVFGSVRWLAVATTSGATHHAWYPADEPQEFFNRSINSWDVIEWAVGWYKEIDLLRRG